MAIGTANPPNLYEQSTFPDFYFRVTNSDHMPELKEKFRRICKFTSVSAAILRLKKREKANLLALCVKVGRP